MLLHPTIPADTPRFHALVTRPEVARMLFMFSPGMSPGKAESFLTDRTWAGGMKFRLAIKEGGFWRGWISVDDAAEPEVFQALEPGAAGRGVAREAVGTLVTFLFDYFDTPALTAGVSHDNPTSMKVLRVRDFHEVGVVPHGSLGRDAPAACQLFCLPRPAGDRGQATSRADPAPVRMCFGLPGACRPCARSGPALSGLCLRVSA